MTYHDDPSSWKTLYAFTKSRRDRFYIEDLGDRKYRLQQNRKTVAEGDYLEVMKFLKSQPEDLHRIRPTW